MIQDAHEDALATELKKCFERDFADFPYNITFNYNKRIINNTLVTKFAFFLQARLPKSKLRKELDIQELMVRMEILPDIIFHDLESPDHNFLMVEVKKTTNKIKADRAMDILKLETATSGDLNYEYGAFIDFKTGPHFNAANPFKLKLYAGGLVIFDVE